MILKYFAPTGKPWTAQDHKQTRLPNAKLETATWLHVIGLAILFLVSVLAKSKKL